MEKKSRLSSVPYLVAKPSMQAKDFNCFHCRFVVHVRPCGIPCDLALLGNVSLIVRPLKIYGSTHCNKSPLTMSTWNFCVLEPNVFSKIARVAYLTHEQCIYNSSSPLGHLTYFVGASIIVP